MAVFSTVKVPGVNTLVTVSQPAGAQTPFKPGTAWFNTAPGVLMSALTFIRNITVATSPLARVPDHLIGLSAATVPWFTVIDPGTNCAPATAERSSVKAASTAPSPVCATVIWNMMVSPGAAVSRSTSFCTWNPLGVETVVVVSHLPGWQLPSAPGTTRFLASAGVCTSVLIFIW